MGSGSGVVGKALGRMVGLVILLYAFDKVLTPIIVLVNTSAFFGTAVLLVQALLGPIGILGAFYVVWDTLKRMQLV